MSLIKITRVTSAKRVIQIRLLSRLGDSVQSDPAEDFFLKKKKHFLRKNNQINKKKLHSDVF